MCDTLKFVGHLQYYLLKLCQRYNESIESATPGAPRGPPPKFTQAEGTGVASLSENTAEEFFDPVEFFKVAAHVKLVQNFGTILGKEDEEMNGITNNTFGNISLLCFIKVSQFEMFFVETVLEMRVLKLHLECVC